MVGCEEVGVQDGVREELWARFGVRLWFDRAEKAWQKKATKICPPLTRGLPL